MCKQDPFCSDVLYKLIVHRGTGVECNTNAEVNMPDSEVTCYNWYYMFPHEALPTACTVHNTYNFLFHMYA